MKVITALLFLISAGFSFAQTTNQTADLATILKNAEKQTQNYREAFKNLLSEETKTFEAFDKNGNLKKRTVVESNFIVYQSATDANVVTEFRNIFKVNGKAVGDSEKRTTELFADIAKMGSVAVELARLQKESSRYDKTLTINGMTLWQAMILSEHIRPFFEFKLIRRENLNGTDTFLVEYRQTKPSPYILISDEQAPKENKLTLGFDLDLPDGFDKSNVFLSGKLWIDTVTFQIRREESEVFVAKSADSTVVALRSEFDYREGDFGILVPKKLAFTYFDVSTKEGIVSARLYAKATLEYAKFGKSDVEIKTNEINSPKN